VAEGLAVADSRTAGEFFYAPITKIDAETRTVWGYASTERRDNDGEIIKIAAIQGALPDYLIYGNIREMHQLSAVGKTVEAFCDDKGLYLGAHVVDDRAWDKVVKKVYQGFSVGGRSLERDPLDRRTVTKMSMHEISLVDRPSNPDAVFDLWKADATYSAPENAASGINNFDLEGQKPKKEGDPGYVAGPAGQQTAEGADLTKREFTSEQRQEAADKGTALKDGSFPIENKEDLENARQALGRAKDRGKAISHIKSRAKALGVDLPENWPDDGDGKDEKVAKTESGLTMAQVLAAAEADPNVTVQDLIAKAATEAVSPAGSAKVPDPNAASLHSDNDTSATSGAAATEAVSPGGSSKSVDPGAPALQSTNQEFGAGVAAAATGALMSENSGTMGGASVPAHGAGAAGEGLKKGMHAIACLANMLCEIKWLLCDAKYEQALEQDSRENVDALAGWLRQGATVLTQTVQHEVAELMAAAGESMDDMDMFELVAKISGSIKKLAIAKRESDTDHAPVKPKGGDGSASVEDKDGDDDMQKLAGAARHPDDIAKIDSLEKRLAQLENDLAASPGPNKSIGGAAGVTISKAMDTVSGFARPDGDDAELMKAFQELPPLERARLMIKVAHQHPHVITNAPGQ